MGIPLTEGERDALTATFVGLGMFIYALVQRRKVVREKQVLVDTMTDTCE